jgi:hypothetical protein
VDVLVEVEVVLVVYTVVDVLVIVSWTMVVVVTYVGRIVSVRWVYARWSCKTGILTGVATVLVDVVTGVLIERHEQALEISAARNLVNSAGTLGALRFLCFGINVGTPAVVVVVVVVVVTAM